MSTITTYNLTLKDTSATMWVDSKPDDQGYIDVSLGLYSGQAEVTTSSKVKILPPKNDEVKVFDTTVTFNQEDKSRHCSHIKSMLDRFDTVNSKDEKAKIAEELLEYLRTTGLEFTKHYSNFKDTVVKKCYELKICNPDFILVTSKANQLLTTLGETLNVPDTIIQEFYCKNCEKYHSHSVTHLQKSVTAPSSTPVTTTNSEFYNADKTLFLTIAKRLDCDAIVKNTNLYFGFYEKNVLSGTLKGHLVTEKMEDYITRWFPRINNDNEGRAKTMKRLFANHNLTYTEDVIPLYNEWLKKYIIFLGRSNRYQKMMRFIELHKHLFSSTF